VPLVSTRHSDTTLLVHAGTGPFTPTPREGVQAKLLMSSVPSEGVVIHHQRQDKTWRDSAAFGPHHLVCLFLMEIQTYRQRHRG